MVDEYVGAMTATDSMGRPLYAFYEGTYADGEVWTIPHQSVAASATYYHPGGMQPAVALAGPSVPEPGTVPRLPQSIFNVEKEPGPLDALAGLVREYLAADADDPTATIEFILAADRL